MTTDVFRNFVVKTAELWTGFIDTDPDPAFQVNPDQDTNPGFDNQKLKKKIQQKNFLFLISIKNCILLIPRPLKRTCLWVTFALLDPNTDPEAPLNLDPIRIRIRVHNAETGCSLLPEAGMNVMDAVLE